MASLKVNERIEGASRLAGNLLKRAPRASDSDRIESLIEAEAESMGRSEGIAAQSSYAASYRAGQRVAAENSAAIITLLEEALESVVAGDNVRAAGLLQDAATYRLTKREQKRKTSPRTVSALYAEYQAQHDTGFHAWLKEQGHAEALASLNLPAPRKRRGS